MFQIRKKFRFEAAHVLESSYSKKCGNLHGHSIVVEVFCQSGELNEDGMVVDFGKLKEIIKPLLDQIDHSIILDSTSDYCDKVHPTSTFLVHFNPTAENLAKLIYQYTKDRILSVSKVRVHETETGFAEYWEE